MKTLKRYNGRNRIALPIARSVRGPSSFRYLYGLSPYAALCKQISENTLPFSTFIVSIIRRILSFDKLNFIVKASKILLSIHAFFRTLTQV